MKRKVDRSIYRVTKRRFALSGSPPLLAEPVFPCPIKDRLVASRTAPLVASLIRERRALWIVSTSPPLPRNCRRERDKGISTEPIIDYFKKESVRVEWNNSIFFFFFEADMEYCRTKRFFGDNKTKRRIRDLIKRCGYRGERAAGFKVKHLERRLKAPRLALDALDCLIFRLRAMLRVAGIGQKYAWNCGGAIQPTDSRFRRFCRSEDKSSFPGNLISFERGRSIVFIVS